VSDQVTDPLYWAKRIHSCGGDLQRAMFSGSPDQFSVIHAKHMRLLKAEIRPTDSILDCGCGYGRLLGMMPGWWTGQYLGVDVSPDFVRLAKVLYPARDFVEGSVEDLPALLAAHGYGRFDASVFVWVRSMVIRECGSEVWGRMYEAAAKVAHRVVVIEADQE